MVEVIWSQVLRPSFLKERSHSPSHYIPALERCVDGFSLTASEIAEVSYLDGGNQNTVLRGSDWVYKVPNHRAVRSLEMTYKMASKQRDIAMAYLGGFIPETHVIPDRFFTRRDAEPTGYVVKQRLLQDPLPVYPQTMEKDDVRRQFLSLLDRNRYLIQHEQASIAFLGKSGTKATIREYLGSVGKTLMGDTGPARLTNVLLEDGRNLRVVDYDFLDLSDRRQRFEYAVNRFVLWHSYFKGCIEREDFDKLLPPLYQISRRKQ